MIFCNACEDWYATPDHNKHIFLLNFATGEYAFSVIQMFRQGDFVVLRVDLRKIANSKLDFRFNLVFFDEVNVIALAHYQTPTC